MPRHTRAPHGGRRTSAGLLPLVNEMRDLENKDKTKSCDGTENSDKSNENYWNLQIEISFNPSKVNQGQKIEKVSLTQIVKLPTKLRKQDENGKSVPPIITINLEV